MPTPVKLPPPGCICGDVFCKIPYGLCHCGCGSLTPISTHTCISRPSYKGLPGKFCRAHRQVIPPPIEDAIAFRLGGEYCRLIPLSRGLWCIVSADRYEYLMQWRWYAYKHPRANRFYAVRTQIINGKKVGFSMHRVILGLAHGNRCTGDHITGEEILNNADHNLRFASYTQQNWNQRRKSINKSGYKGVSWCSAKSKWLAQIVVNGVHKFLGYYSDPEAAYAAYCRAAREHFGEFARLA